MFALHSRPSRFNRFVFQLFQRIGRPVATSTIQTTASAGLISTAAGLAYHALNNYPMLVSNSIGPLTQVAIFSLFSSAVTFLSHQAIIIPHGEHRESLVPIPTKSESLFELFIPYFLKSQIPPQPIPLLDRYIQLTFSQTDLSRISKIPHFTIKYIDNLFPQSQKSYFEMLKTRKSRLSLKESNEWRLLFNIYPGLSNNAYPGVPLYIVTQYFLKLFHKREGIPPSLISKLKKLDSICEILYNHAHPGFWRPYSNQQQVNAMAHKMAVDVDSLKVGENYLTPWGISNPLSQQNVGVLEIIKTGLDEFTFEFYPTCAGFGLPTNNNASHFFPFFRYTKIPGSEIFFSRSKVDYRLFFQSLIEGISSNSNLYANYTTMNHIGTTLNNCLGPYFDKDSHIYCKTPIPRSKTDSSGFKAVWLFIQHHLRSEETISRIKRDFSLQAITTFEKYRDYWIFNASFRDSLRELLRKILKSLCQSWPTEKDIRFQWDIVNHLFAGLVRVDLFVSNAAKLPKRHFPIILPKTNSTQVHRERFALFQLAKSRLVNPEKNPYKGSYIYATPFFDVYDDTNFVSNFLTYADSILFKNSLLRSVFNRWLSPWFSKSFVTFPYGYKDSNNSSFHLAFLFKCIDRLFVIPDVSNLNSAFKVSPNSVNLLAEKCFPSLYYINLVRNDVSIATDLLQIVHFLLITLSSGYRFRHRENAIRLNSKLDRAAVLIVAAHQLALVIDRNRSNPLSPSLLEYGIINPLWFFNRNLPSMSFEFGAGSKIRNAYKYFFQYNRWILSTKYEGKLPKMKQLFQFWGDHPIQNNSPSTMVEFHQRFYDANPKLQSTIRRHSHPKPSEEFCEYNDTQMAIVAFMFTNNVSIYEQVDLSYFEYLQGSIGIALALFNGLTVNSNRPTSSYNTVVRASAKYVHRDHPAISYFVCHNFHFSPQQFSVPGPSTFSMFSTGKFTQNFLTSVFSKTYYNTFFSIPTSHESHTLAKQKDTWKLPHVLDFRLIYSVPNLRAHLILTYFFSHISTFAAPHFQSTFMFLFFKHIDYKEFCLPSHSLVRKTINFCRKGLMYFYSLQPDSVPVLGPCMFFMELLIITKKFTPRLDISEFTDLINIWWVDTRIKRTTDYDLRNTIYLAAEHVPEYSSPFGLLAKHSKIYENTYFDVISREMYGEPVESHQSGDLYKDYFANEIPENDVSSSNLVKDIFSQKTRLDDFSKYKIAEISVDDGSFVPNDSPIASDSLLPQSNPSSSTEVKPPFHPKNMFLNFGSYGRFLNFLLIHITPISKDVLPNTMMSSTEDWYYSLFTQYETLLQKDFFSCRLVIVDNLIRLNLWNSSIDPHACIHNDEMWNHELFPYITVKLSDSESWSVHLRNRQLYNQAGLFKTFNSAKDLSRYSLQNLDIHLQRAFPRMSFSAVGSQGIWYIFKMENSPEKDIIRKCSVSMPYNRDYWVFYMRQYDHCIEWRYPGMGGQTLVYIPARVFDVRWAIGESVPAHLFINARAWMLVDNPDKIYFISCKNHSLIATLDSDCNLIHYAHDAARNRWFKSEIISIESNPFIENEWSFESFEAPSFINCSIIRLSEKPENYSLYSYSMTRCEVNENIELLKLPESSPIRTRGNLHPLSLAPPGQSTNSTNTTQRVRPRSPTPRSFVKTAVGKSSQDFPHIEGDEYVIKISFPRFQSFTNDSLSFTSLPNQPTLLIWDQYPEFQIEIPFPANLVDKTFSNYIVVKHRTNPGVRKIIVPFLPLAANFLSIPDSEFYLGHNAGYYSCGYNNKDKAPQFEGDTIDSRHQGFLYYIVFDYDESVHQHDLFDGKPIMYTGASETSNSSSTTPTTNFKKHTAYSSSSSVIPSPQSLPINSLPLLSLRPQNYEGHLMLALFYIFRKDYALALFHIRILPIGLAWNHRIIALISTLHSILSSATSQTAWTFILIHWILFYISIFSAASHQNRLLLKNIGGISHSLTNQHWSEIYLKEMKFIPSHYILPKFITFFGSLPAVPRILSFYNFSFNRFKHKTFTPISTHNLDLNELSESQINNAKFRVRSFVFPYISTYFRTAISQNKYIGPQIFVILYNTLCFAPDNPDLKRAINLLRNSPGVNDSLRGDYLSIISYYCETNSIPIPLPLPISYWKTRLRWLKKVAEIINSHPASDPNCGSYKVTKSVNSITPFSCPNPNMHDYPPLAIKSLNPNQCVPLGFSVKEQDLTFESFFQTLVASFLVISYPQATPDFQKVLNSSIVFENELLAPGFLNESDTPYIRSIEYELKSFHKDCLAGWERICQTPLFSVCSSSVSQNSSLNPSMASSSSSLKDPLVPKKYKLKVEDPQFKIQLEKLYQSIQNQIKIVTQKRDATKKSLLIASNRNLTHHPHLSTQYSVFKLLGKFVPISLVNLIDYFLKEDIKTYFDHNPSLAEKTGDHVSDSKRIYDIYSKTGNYLLYSTNIQRLERSLLVLDAIFKLLQQMAPFGTPSMLKSPSPIKSHSPVPLIFTPVTQKDSPNKLKCEYLVQELGFLLNQKRSYDLSKFPAFLVFEYRNNLTLRPKQGHLIQKLLKPSQEYILSRNLSNLDLGDSDDEDDGNGETINFSQLNVFNNNPPNGLFPNQTDTPNITNATNNTVDPENPQVPLLEAPPPHPSHFSFPKEPISYFQSSVSQLMMGQGKTSIFLPLLCYQIVKQGKIPIVICPRSQFETVLERLQKTLYDSFKIPLLTFSVSRSTMTSDITYLDKIFRFLKTSPGALMLHRETIQSLRLELEELLSLRNKTTSHFSTISLLYSHLNLIKTHSVGIIDEIDEILDARCLLNYASGHTVHLPEDHNQVVYHIFNNLITDPCSPLLHLETNDQSLVSNANLENVIIPHIANVMYDYLEDSVIKTMVTKLEKHMNDTEFSSSLFSESGLDSITIFDGEDGQGEPGFEAEHAAQNQLELDPPEIPPEIPTNAAPTALPSILDSENLAYANNIQQIPIKQLFINYVTQKFTQPTSIQAVFLRLLSTHKASFSSIECVRKMLTQVLPVTLRRSGGRHYGRLLGHEYGKVVPYSYGQPTIREFGDPYETLAYSFQVACHFGVTLSQVDSYTKYVLKRAYESMKNLQCRLNETSEAKSYHKLTNVWLEDINIPGKIEIARSYINEPSCLHRRLVIETYCVSICVSYHTLRLSASPQLLISLLGPVIGFSGTPWNIEGYPASITRNRYLDPGTEGKIAMTMLQRNSKIHYLSHKAPEHLFMELEQKTITDNWKGFVDAGALFKDFSDFEIAQSILRWGGKDVLFFDDNELSLIKANDQTNQNGNDDEPTVLNIGSTRPEKVAQAGVVMEKAFVFLALAYTSGTDIQQTPLAKYIISLDTQIVRRSILQAVLRLRQFFFNQQVEFCLPKTMKTAIHNSASTIRDILIYSSKNQAIRKSSDFYRSVKQKIDVVFRDISWYDLPIKQIHQLKLSQWMRRWKHFIQIPLEVLPSCIVANPCPTLDVLYKYAQHRLNKCDEKYSLAAKVRIDSIMKQVSENPVAPITVPGNINSLMMGSEIEVETEVLKELVQIESRILTKDLQDELDSYLLIGGNKLNIETEWTFPMIQYCLKKIVQDKFNPSTMMILQHSFLPPNQQFEIPPLETPIFIDPNPNNPLLGMVHAFHSINYPHFSATVRPRFNTPYLFNHYIPPFKDAMTMKLPLYNLSQSSDINLTSNTSLTPPIAFIETKTIQSCLNQTSITPISPEVHQIDDDLVHILADFANIAPEPSVDIISLSAPVSTNPQLDPNAIEIEPNVFVNPDNTIVFFNPNPSVPASSSTNIVNYDIFSENHKTFSSSHFCQLEPKFTFIPITSIFVPLLTKFQYKKKYGSIFSPQIFCSYNFLFATNTLLPVFNSVTRKAMTILVTFSDGVYSYMMISAAESQVFKYYLDAKPTPNVWLVSSDGSSILRNDPVPLKFDPQIFIQINLFNADVRYLRFRLEEFIQYLEDGRRKLKLRFLRLKCHQTKDQEQQFMSLIEQLGGSLDHD